MKVQQFVMAYGVEQDRVRALLPERFTSLRPVLRINAEIRDNENAYLEFNAPAEKDGHRGWINIGWWETCRNSTKNVEGCGLSKNVETSNSLTFEQQGKTTTFRTENLTITFTGVGIQGGCPAEKDNEGCFFKNIGGPGDEGEEIAGNINESWAFGPAEVIAENKEFCDCEFQWNFGGLGAGGKSVGETIPAFLTEVTNIYPRQDFTVENAAVIPCSKVLGSYMVEFER